MTKNYCYFVLIAILFQACQSNNTFEEQAYFASPLESVSIDFELTDIDPTKAQVVNFDNGSSISIPQNAFVDKDGNTITSNVTIAYRQFDNASDIVASGIPMTYTDKEGAVQQLSSGGMFEIQAKANNENVFIASGKSIKTNLASSTPGEFDFYYLDPSKQKDAAYNWEKLTNHVDELPAIDVAAYGSSIFQFDTANYPELIPFTKANWQFAFSDACWNPTTNNDNLVLNTKWKQISISQPQFTIRPIQELNARGEYNISTAPDHHHWLTENDSRITTYNKSGQVIGQSTGRSAYFISSHVAFISNSLTDDVLCDKHLKPIRKLKLSPIPLYFSEQRRIAYGTKNDDDSYELHITDEYGTIVARRKMPIIRSINFDITEDQEHIYAQTLDTTFIFDLKGNTKGKLVHQEDYERIYLGNLFNAHGGLKDVVIIKRTDGGLTIWDWKKDKLYSSTGFDLRCKSSDPEAIESYHLFIRRYANLPYIRLREDGSSTYQLWNWETNTLTAIPDNVYTDYSPSGKLTEKINAGTQKGSILNEQQKTIIEFTPYINVGETPPITMYNDDESRILINIWQETVQLYDNKGTLIRDFKSYDKAINFALLNHDKTKVVTYTTLGRIAVWDLEGKLEHQFNIDAIFDYPNSLDLYPNRIVTESDNTQKAWDLKGNFLEDYGFTTNKQYRYLSTKISSPFVITGKTLTSEATSTCFLADNSTPVPDSNVYQLVLSHEKRQYITYVYLDAMTKSLIQEYNRKIQARKFTEAKRQQREVKLIRSFNINNFGIYNWDKFYKASNNERIFCSPTFNIETEFSNISMFLITGNNRNTVIKFDPQAPQNFSFSSTQYNQLVAILPDNKVAIFNDEDFKQLNIDRIKQTKEVHFEMKKLDAVDDKTMLDAILNPPT